MPDVFDQLAASPQAPAGDVFDRLDDTAPGLRAAKSTLGDQLRNAIFGGSEGETALGRAFPTLAGGVQSDTPTVDLPLIRFEQKLGPDASPVDYLAHGVNQVVSSLTTPNNLAILAATGGLGAIIPPAGYPSVFAKIGNAALGAYFTYQMGQGAAHSTEAAYEAYKRGDDNEALRLLGYGGLTGFLAALGFAHFGNATGDILDTKAPQLPNLRTDIWSAGHGGSFAAAQPEIVSDLPAAESSPVRRAPGPRTVDIQPSPSEPDVFDQLAQPAAPSAPSAPSASAPKMRGRVPRDFEQVGALSDLGPESRLTADAARVGRELTPPPAQPADPIPFPKLGVTTGTEMPEGAGGGVGAGFTIRDVPLDSLQPVENISGNSQKQADVARYAQMFRAGETPPPLAGSYDLETGRVHITSGSRRLAAARMAGVPTLPVAILNDGPVLRANAAQRGLEAKPLTMLPDDDEREETPDPAGMIGAASATPAGVVNLPTSEIHADPARFQFKADTGGAAGVGDELKQIKTFNPDLAGVISVWRDPADGKTYVVNGHHRLELAKRTETPEVSVRYIQAANAGEARRMGALINIAEGRGTAIDAAKVFRESLLTPEQIESDIGVSLRGAVARDGRALANLAPSIFDRVVQGDLPVQRAALIGETLPDHQEQKAALALLDKAEAQGKGLNNTEARELIRFVKEAPRTEQQAENFSLFGEDTITKNLALEKAEVSSYIKQELAKTKKLFSLTGTLKSADVLGKTGNVIKAEENARMAEATAQVQAVYDKLSLSAGPISDALDQAARDLAEGKKPAAQVKQDALERVRAAVRETFNRGVAPDRQGSGSASESGARVHGATPETEAGELAAEPGRSAERERSGEPEAEDLAPEPEDGDGPLRSRALSVKPFGSGATNEDLATAMDFEHHPATAERPAMLYTTQHVNELLRRGAGGESFDGAVLDAKDLAKIRPFLRKLMISSKLSIAGRDKVLRLLQALRKTADAEEYLAVVSEEHAAREEFIHYDTVPQLEKSAGARNALAANPSIDKSIANLKQTGYVKPKQARAALYETVAKLGIEAEWPTLGLDRPEAIASAAHVFKTLTKYFGAQTARKMTRWWEPAIRKEVDDYVSPQAGRTPSGEVQLHGGSGGGDGGGPGIGEGGTGEGPLRAGRRNPSFFDDSDRDRSLFDLAENEAVAESAARDRDQLEGQRLTAQLNAPLTREEQLKKLKRSKDKPQQNLFEADEAPPQGSLFFEPSSEPATPPARPQTQPSLFGEEPAAGPALKAQKLSNGKWEIGGMLRIPMELALVRNDGKPPTAEDIHAANVAGPGFAGLGPRVFDTKEEAQAALDAYNAKARPGSIEADEAPPQRDESASGPSSSPLYAFRNERDGTQGEVVRLANGKYAASLRDLDSGEVLPTHYHYDSEEKAIAKAKELVFGKGSGSITLGSGLGALQPYVEKFLDGTVTPTAEQAGELIAVAKNDILKVLAPGAVPGAEKAHLIVRMNAAELARSTDRAQAALAVAGKYFDKQTPEANYDFMARMERGAAQADAALNGFAKLMKAMLDERRDAVRELGTGKLEHFIEDYFPHIWENTKEARTIFSNLAKRPLEGSKNFLETRTIDSIAQGLALGLKPVSDNPVELVLLKLREMDKYLMAHHALADLKAAGQLTFHQATSETPEGFRKINDKVATVYVAPSQEGAVQVQGYWTAPEPAARILNNYLSPGLREKSILFRGFLTAANVLNQAQLGLSAFHLSFTTLDVATSKLALGIYQLAHGDLAKGLHSITLTPVSPVTNILRGDKMLKEWYKPGTQGARIAQLVDAAVEAGGRAHMDSFYETKITKQMMQAFRAGNLLRGALRVPFAAIEQAARPIMEYIVPRQKMGVFADLAQYELARLGPDANDHDVRAALARAWDSVDNRLGQLVYDNLAWNKVVKDLAMVSVRAVGWNVGTIREVGGGAADAVKLVGGRAPDGMTTRTSYLLALNLMAGLLGALAYYLLHGHAPTKLKDYYFPVDAHGHRWSMPSYVKDEYAWLHDPTRAAAGKINPLVSTLWEMLANKDFFDHPIRNPHDPLVKQAEEEAAFLVKQFVPLGLRADESKHPRVPPAERRALGFVGVTPAPKSLDELGSHSRP